MSDYPIALFLCQEFSDYGRYNFKVKIVENPALLNAHFYTGETL